MTVNYSKSCLGYCKKVVDEYKNNYHPCIGKEPIDADYYALTEGIETNPQASEFKVGDGVRITKNKNIFST